MSVQLPAASRQLHIDCRPGSELNAGRRTLEAELALEAVYG